MHCAIVFRATRSSMSEPKCRRCSAAFITRAGIQPHACRQRVENVLLERIHKQCVATRALTPSRSLTPSSLSSRPVCLQANSRMRRPLRPNRYVPFGQAEAEVPAEDNQPIERNDQEDESRRHSKRYRKQVGALSDPLDYIRMGACMYSQAAGLLLEARSGKRAIVSMTS